MLVCICFDRQLIDRRRKRSAVHKNGQNNVGFGQFSNIFESWNYFQLHNFKPNCFHKSLKTLKIYRFGGLEQIKHECRSHNSSRKFYSMTKKLPLRGGRWSGPKLYTKYKIIWMSTKLATFGMGQEKKTPFCEMMMLFKHSWIFFSSRLDACQIEIWIQLHVTLRHK